MLAVCLQYARSGSGGMMDYGTIYCTMSHTPACGTAVSTTAQLTACHATSQDSIGWQGTVSGVARGSTDSLSEQPNMSRTPRRQTSSNHPVPSPRITHVCTADVSAIACVTWRDLARGWGLGLMGSDSLENKSMEGSGGGALKEDSVPFDT